MTRKVKLPLYGNPGKVAEVDIDATEGAIVGVNLRRQDGSLVTEEDLGGGVLVAAQAASRQAANDALARARRALDFLREGIDREIAAANAEVERIRTEVLASVAGLETQLEGIEDEIFRVDSNDPGLIQSINGIKFDLFDQSGYIAEQARLSYEPDPGNPPAIFGQRLLALRGVIEGYSDALIADEQIIRAEQDAVLARRAEITDAVLNIVDPTNPNDPTTARSLALEAIEQDIQATESGLVAQGLQISSLSTTVNSPSTGVAATAAGLTALTTRVTAAEGNITSTATQLNTLSASVGEVEADITSLSTIVVGPQQPGQNPPVNLRHALRLNANGHVVGMFFGNNGTTGEVTFVADTFQITSPSLSNPVTPFIVAPDPDNLNVPTVFITDAKIQNLTVDQINGGRVRSDWIIDDTQGSITLQSGGFQKIIGAGFGTAGQFIEWFGPVGSALNEANAISYIKTDGTAFYQQIIAGNVSNFERTTNPGAGASLTVSHQSNGRAVTVNVSYRLEVSTFASAPNPGDDPTITVNLLVNVNGVNYTPVASGISVNQGGGLFFGEATFGATYTIPAGAAGTRNITVSISSRALPVYVNQTGQEISQQSISIGTSE
jgi:hypothetical protein